MRKKLKFLIPALALCAPHLLWAADANPNIYNGQKHYLNHVVQLQITSKGMGFFGNHLDSVIRNLNFDINEGYFPAFNYAFTKPINIDDYKDKNPEAVATYHQVKDALTKWLTGFQLNPHLPSIQIGDSGYQAEFSRFALVADEALMHSLGKTEGAVLAIELDVKKLTISSKSVTVKDLNNPFIGEMGFEDLTLVAGSKDAPLKMRLPFYIRVNQTTGLLEFEALQLTQNMDQIPLSMAYKRLIVPTFSVEVNGNKYFLNTQELDRTFQQQAPTILASIKNYLGQFMENDLPKLLNEKANANLKGSLEEEQSMAPAGKKPGDTREDLRWALRLQNISLKNTFNVQLAGYMEDPLNQKSEPAKSAAARALPNFNLVPQDRYDLALSLDRALLNRATQLGFERGNFRNMVTGGKTISLTKAPVFDYAPPPKGVTPAQNETYLKMHVSIQIDPGNDFKTRLALKKIIVLEFDILAKLAQRSDKNGMDMIPVQVLEDSMTIDDSYLTLAGLLLKSSVYSGIRDSLHEITVGWQKKADTLADALPLPPELLGFKMDIVKVQMDVNGNLVMFLNIKQNAAATAQNGQAAGVVTK
jgi:hypothetical protein